MKDPTKRIGFKQGFEEIKKSEFCRGIPWEAIMKLQIPNLPPAKFNPSSTSANLMSAFFDADYTQLSPRLSLNQDPKELIIDLQNRKAFKMKRSKSL